VSDLRGERSKPAFSDNEKDGKETGNQSHNYEAEAIKGTCMYRKSSRSRLDSSLCVPIEKDGEKNRYINEWYDDSKRNNNEQCQDY
jgi:hypothetical protein